MNTTETASLRRFDSDSVFVSLLPRVFPHYKEGLSEEEKIAEYKESTSRPKEISLTRLVHKCDDKAVQMQHIYDEPDRELQLSMICRELQVVTISTSIWTMASGTSPKERIKEYNGVVVLLFEDVDSVEATKQKLVTLPYLWYAGRGTDGRSVIALVPTDNRDYRKHDLYFGRLEAQMRTLGLKAAPKGRNPLAVYFIWRDPDPVINDSCCLYSLSRQHKHKLQEE